MADYLDDPIFADEHDGPLVGAPSRGRDPSPAQIQAMAAAIRRAYPRLPTGESRERWSVPTCESPEWFDERLA